MRKPAHVAHEQYLKRAAEEKEMKPSADDFRHPPLLVSLHSRQRRRDPPGLKTIEFCKGCEDPETEGSFVKGLTAAQGVNDYYVQADLVYAVPNDGRERLLNAHHLKDRIVLFDRGTISLVEKVLMAQEAGGVAVIIVDDGQCDEDFSSCGRAGSIRDEGFAKKDQGELWRKVEIPAILVTEIGGQRFKNLLHLDYMEIPGMGFHFTDSKS